MTKLKLNGKPYEQPLSLTTIRVKNFLDSSPVDEIFTIQELAARAKVNPGSIRYNHFFESPTLKNYNTKTPASRYWGNPKAISEFVRQSKP
jgi:hypothetical protein